MKKILIMGVKAERVQPVDDHLLKANLKNYMSTQSTFLAVRF